VITLVMVLRKLIHFLQRYAQKTIFSFPVTLIFDL